MASPMAQSSSPSLRALTGIALILLLIAVWAAFVASLARVVGGWPILVQAAFYLAMGIVWIIPLKPLVRWIVTGSFRTRPKAGSGPQD
jgi:hypothetical protein